ncbi:LORF1 protein, partial [Crocuta crocuta]
DAMTARIDKAEEQISDIENKIMENNEVEKKRETKVLNHKGRLREFSDLLRCSNIHIIRVPEDEEREKGAKCLLKQIIAENFLNLGKNTDIKIQEAQGTHIELNQS